MLLGFVGTMALGALLAVALSIGIGLAAGDSVLPGVTVAGVDLSGLDRNAAADRLRRDLPSLSAGEAIVSIAGTEQVVSYSSLGRDYDIQATIDGAMAIGRDGGDPFTDGIARLRTLAHPSPLPVVVHPYDPDALATVALQIATRASTWPIEAAVLREGAAFRVRPGEAGQVVEAGAVADALAAAIDNPDPSDVRLELTPATVPPLVDSATAEAAVAAAEAMVADLQLTIANADAEEAPLALTAETIGSWIGFGPEGELAYTARVDSSAVAAHVAALAAGIDREPLNAQISVAAGGGLGGVLPGHDGRALNVDASVSAIVDALKQRAGGAGLASVPLAIDITEAPFTTAEAEAQLPQMQMVSSWTTHFVPGEGNGFGANITIGAYDIDGRNLAPGEWFSFWGSIGPVTLDRGYSYGGAIIDGRSTQGVALGGGICSTSTTIFNAALRAGLEMGTRLNHFYYIDRYPDGLDATVSIIDGWVQDMTFRNDTDSVIVIRGFGGRDSVTFQLWAIPTGRQVVITDPVTSNHRAAIDTTVVDASLAPGSQKRIEYPHHGHDVSRTRYVYDANGNLLHQNTYFSSYATVNGIVAVGPAAAAAPPAEETPSEGATTGEGDQPAPPDAPPNG